MEMYELMRSVCDGISVLIFLSINVMLLVHFSTTLLGFLHRQKKDVYVLVTGCDMGFGYGIAMELSKRNTFVFAGCLTQNGVDRLKGEKKFNGIAFIMDITKPSDIDNAKQIVEDEVKGKGLWAVVNNAGILKIGPIEWQSVNEMQNTMDVNLWGAVNVTKAMLPFLKLTRGRLVNITSMGGRVLLLNGTSYSMSKYALEAFSDGLRYEMKPWGVSVHIIEPGMFQTNILDKSNLRNEWKDIWEIQPEEIKQSYGEEYYRSAVDITDDLVNTLASPNTHKVVNSVCHAVLSSSPKSRYPVGFDAHTLWMAIATLPTTIGDFITSILVKPMTPAARK